MKGLDRTPGKLLSAALLRAQRSSMRPPAIVRRAARHVLRRGVGDALPVQTWATALVGGRTLGRPPTALSASIPIAVPLEHRHRDHARRLSCVLATDAFDVGGSEEVVAFLARRLSEHGIDTMVAYSGPQDGPHAADGRLATALRDEAIEVVAVTEDSAAALIDKRRPDVVSAHGAPSWWLELAARTATPYVETLHGMHSLFDADWTLESARSAGISRVIAVSELLRQQYLAGNPSIDPARVVTVPNSVDHLRLPRLGHDECRAWLGLRDEFLFVSLARFSLQKNTYGLVEAFAEVAATHPDAHLLIAGRPDDIAYAHQVRRLRDGLACRDRIHLRDHTPSPAALLAAADGCVLDSFFEGWSLASMEALYAGVPVVLSDVGGAREQVGEGGERGYIVGNPVGDPLGVNWTSMREALYSRQPNRDELVTAMTRMVDERERWASRRDELRQESAGRFHPDRALAGHAGVLRIAAGEPMAQRGVAEPASQSELAEVGT